MTTVLQVRNLDKEIAAKFRLAAAARGMRNAIYLTALVRLHEAIRARADVGDAALQAELMELGLETVAM